MQNVTIYCDAVDKTNANHELMKQQEGPLNDKIGYAGIPTLIILAHREYFRGLEAEIKAEEAKSILGQQYANIIEACRATGWKLPSER